MCRALSYLGPPITIEELLYMPDNSFVKQSYNPKYMSHILNLAGFGLVAWDKLSYNPELPFIYKTTQLPFYDANLRNIAAKIQSPCFLAHIRGVSYSEKQIISSKNIHPFLFTNATFAMAHNGVLRDFDKMKYDLLDYIDPKFQIEIYGTTDSEWIYAVFLTQLTTDLKKYTPNIIYDALIKTFKILNEVRHKHNIAITSPINLFISNGEYLIATRFVLDFGWSPANSHDPEHLNYHSLWYTYGERYSCVDGQYKMQRGTKKKCIIIASEPLTEDTITWIELPEYTSLIAWLEEDEVKIVSHDIRL